MLRSELGQANATQAGASWVRMTGSWLWYVMGRNEGCAPASHVELTSSASPTGPSRGHASGFCVNLAPGGDPQGGTIEPRAQRSVADSYSVRLAVPIGVAGLRGREKHANSDQANLDLRGDGHDSNGGRVACLGQRRGSAGVGLAHGDLDAHIHDPDPARGVHGHGEPLL